MMLVQFILQSTSVGQQGTPSDQTVQRFSEALVYADSIALAAAVVLLFIAIVFRLSELRGGSQKHIRELVAGAIALFFVGNTAVVNAYPDSAIVKAVGYLLALTLLTWRSARLFERYTIADGQS